MLDSGEFGGCATQRAGDVERVAGAGRAAAQGATGGGRADEDNVCEDQIAGGFGGVAARQRDTVKVGESAQAGEEAIDPEASGAGGEHLAGQREREEDRQRTRSHCGQIAQSAGESAVAD